MKRLIGFLCILIFLNCATNHYFSRKLKKSKTVIAVLPFTGKGMSKTLGYLAADELTTLIYIEKKIPVVDRSRVNFILKELEIENPYFLSRDNLTTIADSLGANVIILGMMNRENESPDPEKSVNYLNITLRFLDAESGEVIGIIYEKDTTGEPPFKVIPVMLENIVRQL